MKPNKDGYYRRAFTFNGRQYRAVGKTEELMLMDLAEKKAALKRGENQIDAAMTVRAWSKVWPETYIRPKVRPAGAPKVQGTMTQKSYSMYTKRIAACCPCARVGTLHSPRKRGAMAAFHETTLFNTTDLREYEANIFASELLLSDEDVLETPNEDTFFFRAASKLYVPAELLDFKFRVLKRKGYKLESPINANSNFLKNIEKCPHTHIDGQEKQL